MLLASFVVVLVTGVLLPWWFARSGVRWSATQSALLAGTAVALAVVVLGRYARRLGGFGRRRVRVAAVTLLALVVASTLLIVLRARVDQLRGELRDATMTLSDDGRVLRIEGYIADDFVDDLQEQIASNPGLRRLDITSAGGLTDEALRAAGIVRAHRLGVRAIDQCASGCVLMWAATDSREMHVAAVVGVHRARLDPSVPGAWEPRVRDKFEAPSLALLREAGFSDEMLDRRADTAADDMAYFDAAELLEHGVSVTVVDDEGKPLTPGRVRKLLGHGSAAATRR